MLVKLKLHDHNLLLCKYFRNDTAIYKNSDIIIKN